MPTPSRLALCALVFLAGCGPSETKPTREHWSADADENGHTAPTAATRAANEAFGARLPLADDQDFEDARRGLVARDPNLVVTLASGNNWDMAAYDFVDGEAPPSVNPSLWRQAKLNNIHGLFKVTEGVHQLRGWDLSNMTLIDGESGWIVVDPLTAEGTARAALAFAREKLGPKKVSAIIITHSHVDHFGGILGIFDDP
ncbi:MAG: MBL fold metallo-hydrolase, partial [bacterium]|nr:MBL fold metallo-hydrolase [bacterium]